MLCMQSLQALPIVVRRKFGHSEIFPFRPWKEDRNRRRKLWLGYETRGRIGSFLIGVAGQLNDSIWSVQLPSLTASFFGISKESHEYGSCRNGSGTS
jgi:hypothetical protein